MLQTELNGPGRLNRKTKEFEVGRMEVLVYRPTKRNTKILNVNTRRPRTSGKRVGASCPGDRPKLSKRQ